MNLQVRKIIRLQGYDYSHNGVYFITICVNERKTLFGCIEEGKMICNAFGKIAIEEIENTNKSRNNHGIKITNYIVMPNHVHMIIEIFNKQNYISTEPQYEQFSRPTKQSIPTIIRAYKSMVTKRIHEMCEEDKFNAQIPKTISCPYVIWQSRFHDHIVRNENEYQKICEYINTNPLKWESDCFYMVP